MQVREALTFDDVTLIPAASTVLPTETAVDTKVTNEIRLGIPLLSAAMDTVTEGRLAIAMAQAGGLGIIHKNMTPEAQAQEVRRVKKFEAGMVVNPLTIAPDRPVSEALRLKEEHGISGIPVVEEGSGRLVGILTNRDVRFETNADRPVREIMTADNLITVREDVDRDEAKRLLHRHRIEKLVVVDGDYRCVGLVTVKDIERAQAFPHACKDAQGQAPRRRRHRSRRGRAGAGRGAARRRVRPHRRRHGARPRRGGGARRGGHQDAQQLRPGGGRQRRHGDGARALIDAGADAIKVGIGPGSICTTRVIAGVGVPQLTAIVDAVEVARDAGVTVIADGGIKFSGDLAKAIAAGADCAMIGSLFAGTEESPGEVFLYQGRSYKSYRGMGSLGAMARGSADRYFQAEISDRLKLVPEGIEGRVPFKGPLTQVIHQLVGGLRAAMGYTGCATLAQMQRNCEFARVSAAGLRESHVHDVGVMREPPNYQPSH